MQDDGYTSLIHLKSFDHGLKNLDVDDKGVIVLQIKPDQVFLLEADHKIVFYYWAAS